MKKYQVVLGMFPADKIKEVDCERESPSCLWVGGFRRAKRSQDYNYFDTWEDAHAALMDNAQEMINDARIKLQRAQDFYGNVKGLKNPSIKD